MVEKNLAKKRSQKGSIISHKDQVISLGEMPETSELIKFSSISVSIIGAIFKGFQSQASRITYICMIMSMILNASFITILYPLAVFGFALMEERRPGKTFWNIMATYTIVILFLKMLIQLDIFVYIEIIDHFKTINVSFLTNNTHQD